MLRELMAELAKLGGSGRPAIRRSRRSTIESGEHGSFLCPKSGTAKGVIFITIEDECGVASLVVCSSHYERHAPVILGSSMIRAPGHVRPEGMSSTS